MVGWEELRFFLEVCRAGTLAGAAQRLGVDETTVGRRVARLEAALEAKLTSRLPEGLILTPAGETARRSAEEMEGAALVLERRAMGLDRRAAGRVRITAPVILGTYVVLPALQQVIERHPDIAIEFLATIARLDVRREVDLAIRTVRPREPGLVHRRLGRYAMAPYVRASPGIQGRRPVSVVTFTTMSRPPIRPIEDRFPGARVALRTSSMETLVEATRRGLGAADLPCFHADADPGLVRLFPQEPPQLMDVWLVVQADVHRANRIRVVVRSISEHFARVAPMLEGRSEPPRESRGAEPDRNRTSGARR